MAGALAARWLLTAVFAAAGLGSRPVPGRPVPGRVGTARAAARVSVLFHALMCAAARPGVRELGVEAGGLMARAFVALREKMGTAAGSGHILATGLADGNWRPT